MKNTVMILVAGIFFFAACQMSPKQPEYQLVWADEFDYKGMPDSMKWTWDTAGNAWSWGNNEAQHYTSNRLENAFVDSQFLHIVAIKEKTANKEYSSARLVSREKGDWLYGKMEVRAKLPKGRGIWSAIWMLPTDWEYGDWPHSGEIDIMENVGYLPDSVFGSAHTGAYNHTKHNQKISGIFVKDLYSDFHNFTLEWDSTEYRIFVDTTQYFSFRKESDDPEKWPFNRRFHMILNVAVGGNWGAVQGIDSTIFPQVMLVDYVRVYQLKN